MELLTWAKLTLLILADVTLELYVTVAIRFYSLTLPILQKVIIKLFA